MSNTTATNDCYDVVIVGGGMVGASLALQLSRYSDDNIKILVVESFPLQQQLPQQQPSQQSITDNIPSYSPSFDARSTALSYGSRKILEPLGIWDSIAEHLAPIQSIHVSDRGRPGSTTMHADHIEWPSLGYVVENAWLGNVLMASLRQCQNVEFLAPAAVTGIKPRRSGVDISISNATQPDPQQPDPRICDKNSPDSDIPDINTSVVHAQLAIVADGANSSMREYLGIGADITDYGQSALIANVSFSQAHNGMAYERFTDSGPMALLPLTASEQGESRSALVWTMDSARANYLCHCDTEEFLYNLQQRFGHRQGEFTRVGNRFNYPLKLIEAKEQVRSGVVIMGNAAHSMHPVAGQGFNLALRDCARLSALLVEAFISMKPLGALNLLSQYFQQQQFDQQKTILFSDKVTTLFSHQNRAVSLLRMLGLGAFDLLPAAKREFISQGAGLHNGAAGAIRPDIMDNIVVN